MRAKTILKWFTFSFQFCWGSPLTECNTMQVCIPLQMTMTGCTHCTVQHSPAPTTGTVIGFSWGSLSLSFSTSCQIASLRLFTWGEIKSEKHQLSTRVQFSRSEAWLEKGCFSHTYTKAFTEHLSEGKKESIYSQCLFIWLCLMHHPPKN